MEQKQQELHDLHKHYQSLAKQVCSVIPGVDFRNFVIDVRKCDNLCYSLAIEIDGDDYSFIPIRVDIGATKEALTKEIIHARDERREALRET